DRIPKVDTVLLKDAVDEDLQVHVVRFACEALKPWDRPQAKNPGDVPGFCVVIGTGLRYRDCP
ncbi:MAG TPA: hypothetical protein VHL57_10070, partial [Flavobacteriales bacterium]|nr:hypothetical protein [Flavobacteriales bacterium]